MPGHEIGAGSIGQTVFLGSEIYRGSSYGNNHPLAIPRVSLVIDLCRALGWFADDSYVDTPEASEEELAKFHDRDYIAAVRRAERNRMVSRHDRETYNLGTFENPVFPEMFSRPATACGGSLLAARLIRDGGCVYNPAGGTHHGQRARASGFCYFNDPVLAILELLGLGLARILYVDIDAHHGDGVEAAFRSDSRVVTLSIHEEKRWPFTGKAHDRGMGNSFNFPVPREFNDSELDFLMEHAVVPIAKSLRPEAIVLQCGADALADDPLSRLTLSNNAIWRVVAELRRLSPRYLVLGGGGYNPWSVARCWVGVWATLADRPIPKVLPDAIQELLREVRWKRSGGSNPKSHWFTTLRDPLRIGPVRSEILQLVEQLHVT